MKFSDTAFNGLTSNLKIGLRLLRHSRAGINECISRAREICCPAVAGQAKQMVTSYDVQTV